MAQALHSNSMTGRWRSMTPDALEAAIKADLAAGHLPVGVIACVGGTSIGAIDDIAAIGAIARRYGLYLHVDAAWAGSAMICPEFRHLMAGAEKADSVVFNPHKWLATNFAKGKKNKDLWVKFYSLYSQHQVRFHWVKGHAENEFNNRCDELATSAADSRDLLIDEGYEMDPGKLLM